MRRPPVGILVDWLHHTRTNGLDSEPGEYIGHRREPGGWWVVVWRKADGEVIETAFPTWSAPEERARDKRRGFRLV